MTLNHTLKTPFIVPDWFDHRWVYRSGMANLWVRPHPGRAEIEVTVAQGSAQLSGGRRDTI